MWQFGRPDHELGLLVLAADAYRERGAHPATIDGELHEAASAVVANIIDTVVGRTAITFRTTGVLDADSPAARMGTADIEERSFLRFRVTDKPGVLAQITGILGDHGISIASVIQHDAADAAESGVPLVIMTHVCPSQAVQRAVAAIDTAGVTLGPSTCLSVLDDWTPAK